VKDSVVSIPFLLGRAGFLAEDHFRKSVKPMAGKVLRFWKLFAVCKLC
jgi:hypothetical protein